jgi:hypothetical protein
MRKFVLILLLLLFIGCSDKYYQKKDAKIKQSYFNAVQFNNKEQKKKYQKDFDKLRKKKKNENIQR